MPTGGRPQGYIWVPSINGFRRTLVQTNLDEQRLAEQLWNSQQPRRPGQAMDLFGPDLPNATLLEILWYVSACGHHVPWNSFNIVANAFKAAVDKTGDRGQLMMAYERGERQELGHLQSIAHLLAHGPYKEKLRRWLRAALLLSTDMFRAKVGLVFFTGQAWAATSRRTLARRITATSRTLRCLSVCSLFSHACPSYLIVYLLTLALVTALGSALGSTLGSALGSALGFALGFALGSALGW